MWNKETCAYFDVNKSVLKAYLGLLISVGPREDRLTPLPLIQA